MKEKTSVKKIAPPRFGALIKENKIRIITGAAYLAAAYAFGGAELLFETSPLGLAFVCTVREGVPLAALGLMISAIVRGGGETVIYLSALIVALGFRYALSFVLHRDKSSIYTLNDGTAPRVASSAAGALTASLIRIIYGGFRYYDLIAGAFFILCACGAVYAYASFTDREYRDTQRYEAGIGVMIFSAVISLRGLTVFSVSLSSFAAFLLTLYSARRGGALRGIVAGFICGAATDLTLCPVFGAIGFLCGLLSPLQAYIGVLFSVVAGLFIGLQTGGFQTLTANLPEAASASCAILAAEYFGLVRRLGAASTGQRNAAAQGAYAAALSDGNDRLRSDIKKLADAYKSISELTADISASERKPDKNELRGIISEVFADSCADCRKNFVCYPGRGMISRSQLNAVADALTDKKNINRTDLPEETANNCKFADGLAVRLNIVYSEYLKRLSLSDKAGSVSADCRDASRLLYGVLKNHARGEENERSSVSVASLPHFRELFRGGVVVSTGRKTYLTAAGDDTVRIRHSAEELKKAAEKALSARLCTPEITVNGDTAVFRTETAPLLRAETAVRDKPRTDEIVNGDASFYTECDDRFFCAVCDGMGSGRDAAVSSRLTSIVLGRLLYAGCDRAAALDALNRIIRERRAECFSTVDMLEADLLDGKAVFYKCGACPSFILRGGKVYKLASHTPPVGIMKELCAEKIEFQIKAGDTAVIISDGITGQDGDDSWLTVLLSELDCTADGICEAVIEEAEKRNGRRDDMTVMAVRFTEEKL